MQSKTHGNATTKKNEIETDHEITMQALKDKFGHDWIISRYLHARSLEREIIIYSGPTNSGKTYHAFKDAYQHKRITYFAPLRLLAMEGYDRFLSDGKNACMITGEERIGDEHADCLAATIEMCDASKIKDVVIIDEAQMLIDPERGAAWTAALLGASARKIILTCPEESVMMLQSLFAITGEPVNVKTLTRLSSLKINNSPVKITDITPGSALIAFSRRDLLSYKELFEAKKMRCALIYGALSPEVRREQARRFNDGEADILLSTDAIAMGLNLPISSIVISDHVKFDGKKEVPVDPALLRQIGGRAGRYGMAENGVVMTMSPLTQKSVEKAFKNTPTFVLTHFPLALDQTMVTIISNMIDSLSLKMIQAHFEKIVNASHTRFKSYITDDQRKLFDILDSEKYITTLTLGDRFLLSCAPVNDQNKLIWQRAVDAILNNKILTMPVSRFDLKEANSDNDLKGLEQCVARLSLYRWLHYRFEDSCPDLTIATERLNALNTLITKALSQKIQKRCECCTTVIPHSVPHRLCDTCFIADRKN